ncbi:MAG: copper-binding protein [Gammaproteobacteria bacterium]|nr:copper-binding protein [Gammaproteobacteria bacterium]MBU0829045.1 copper-binding protein [Gammaproteobacteria bacterium]MBU0892589.1 copper-binding protein [Gammaproteobacteria bacterium]MBU1819855.1 copper-binding protein [Gammaproteobacteria bacterium]
MAQRTDVSRRYGSRLLCWTEALALGAIVIGIASAQSAASAPAVREEGAAPAAPVFTRARLVSVGPKVGNKLYVQLKLLPLAKLPFTTQTFRVMDGVQLAGIPEGSWVKFTARHVEGDNTVTSIQLAEECKRFQPCD